MGDTKMVDKGGFVAVVSGGSRPAVSGLYNHLQTVTTLSNIPGVQ